MGCRKYEAMVIKISTHWILTVLNQKDTNSTVSIFNIYAPNSYGEKINCWNLLREERSNLQGNVILARDLNIILNPNEKRGGSRSRDPITDMVEDLIMTWNLIDIKPASGKYTWTNRRFGPGHIAARLDRFLIQDNFLLLGLIISTKILPFGGSDHKPILLEMEQEKNLGPIPFRFNSMWAKHEDFLKLVAGSWIYPVTGSPFFVWEEKLRRLKKILKIWAKSLPKPNESKIHAAQALGAHQAEMEDKLVTIIDIQKETNLHLTLHAACRQEADWWRLKSRIKWLKEDNTNSSFFHKSTEARKSTNNVSEIKVNDQDFSQFDEIKEEASNYFSELFTNQPTTSDAQLLDLVPSAVTSNDNDLLNRIITMDELREAIAIMEEDRAPGAAGFNVNFISIC